MSWVTLIIDPNHNKVKINWFYLKKIVLGTIQRDQFLYIFLEFGYKLLQYFSLHSLIPLPQGLLSLLYYPHSFIPTLHM